MPYKIGRAERVINNQTRVKKGHPCFRQEVTKRERRHPARVGSLADGSLSALQITQVGFDLTAAGLRFQGKAEWLPRVNLIDEFLSRHREHPDRAALMQAEAILHVAHQLHELMTSLDRLTAATTANTSAITALTGSVDAAVSDIGQGAAGDAALDALSGALEANNANLAAQQARLDAAVNPPPPPVPTPAPTPAAST